MNKTLKKKSPHIQRQIDSAERNKFVKAILDFTTEKDNSGFTPEEFFEYLDKIGLRAKSKIISTNEPNRRNDLLSTTQKAAQDWGIMFLHVGQKGNNKYYVDDRTARYRKLSGRRPKDAVYYSGSKRGFARRLKTKRSLNISDFDSVNEKITEMVFDNQLEDEIEQILKGEYVDDEKDGQNTKKSEEDSKNDEDLVIDSSLQPDFHSRKRMKIGNEVEEGMEDNVNDNIEDSVSKWDENKMISALKNCIQMRSCDLQKYGFEGRFYFLTTFLLNEGLIPNMDFTTIFLLDQDKIKMMYDQVTQKYANIFRDHIDEDSYVYEYACAMKAAFSFPLQMSEDTHLYWEICSKYNRNKINSDEVLKLLKAIKPEYVR